MSKKIEDNDIKIKNRNKIKAKIFSPIFNLTFFSSLILYELPIVIFMLFTKYLLYINMDEFWLKIMECNFLFWYYLGPVNAFVFGDCLFVSQKFGQNKSSLFPSIFILITDIVLVFIYFLLKKLGLYGAAIF